MDPFSREQIDKLVADWLSNLRSGKYKQTAGVLRRADGFCCLGVLCDTLIQHDPETFSWRHNGDDPSTFCINGQSQSVTSITAEIRSMIRFNGSDGDFGPDQYGRTQHLTALNDRGGYSFEQIADAIENHKDVLFQTE